MCLHDHFGYPNNSFCCIFGFLLHFCYAAICICPADVHLRRRLDPSYFLTFLSFFSPRIQQIADHHKSQRDLPLNQAHRRHHSFPFATQLCGSIIGKAKHRLNPIWEVWTWSWAETARDRAELEFTALSLSLWSPLVVWSCTGREPQKPKSNQSVLCLCANALSYSSLHRCH